MVTYKGFVIEFVFIFRTSTIIDLLYIMQVFFYKLVCFIAIKKGSIIKYKDTSAFLILSYCFGSRRYRMCFN